MNYRHAMKTLFSIYSNDINVFNIALELMR